jgi:hypothetical protein
MRTNRVLCAGTIAVVGLVSPPVATVASAQAFVPAAGEMTVSVMYQNLFVSRHYAITTPIDAGQTDSSTFVIDTTYGLTRKLAVDFGVPVVAGKYSGIRPHPTVLDDGSYHTTFQDFRLSLRYNLVSKGVVLTPVVTLTIPSHDYEFYAHAAPGKRLRMLQFGAYAAKILDPLIPGAFVQTRYSFGFVEKVIDISRKRSDLDVEVGYFITEKLRAFALGHGQVTHGGFDWPMNYLRVWTPSQIARHDQITRENFLNVGAGAALSLSDNVDLFGSFMRTVAARNAHAHDRMLSIGLSFSVRRPSPTQEAPAVTAAASERSVREGSLVRCVCQKGGR